MCTYAASTERKAVRSLGCREPPATLPGWPLNTQLIPPTPAMTVRRCAVAAAAAGVDGFAIRNGTACFGGASNDLATTLGSMDAAACMQPCRGAGAGTDSACGGPDALAVFSLQGGVQLGLCRGVLLIRIRRAVHLVAVCLGIAW